MPVMFTNILHLNRNRLVIYFLLVLSLVGAAIPVHLYAETGPLRIAFFNMMTPEDYWWNNTSKIIQKACDDFGIKLDIYYADENQFLMRRQLEQALTGASRLHGVIFPNVKGNIIELLKLAEKYKTPALVFNAGLNEKEAEIFGGPREKFSFWVGQILPNDEQAGYDLAEILFSKARKKGLTDNHGRLHVLGIGGTLPDIAAIKRKKGLLRAVQENPDVVLHQVSPASWDRQRGKSVFLGLKSRYPDTKIVWAANDPMGLGVIDGIKSLHLHPGKDIMVGSIDWIPDALDAVRRGELAVSIGGHFMESAWCAVLFYDYFNNIDFASETVRFQSSMGILTSDNIDAHLQIFGTERFSKVNFTKYSKAVNPDLGTYDFTFDSIFNNRSK